MMIRKLILFVLAMFAFLGAAFAQSPAGLPVVHVGDVWTYRDVDSLSGDVKAEFSFRALTISDGEIGAQQKLSGSPKTNMAYFTREWNPIDFHGRQYEPYWPNLKFPLAVGLSWEQKYRISTARGPESIGFAKCSVVALENVTVPAGTYVAYKIHIEDERRGVNDDIKTVKGISTIWYSPAINNYLRIEHKTIAMGRVRAGTLIELIGYTPTEKGSPQK